MNKKYWLIGGIAVVVIIAIYCTSLFNRVVKLSQDVDQAWSKVEVQYQRRMDLIPNIVASVKGYAQHESSTLEKVAAASAGLSEAYNKAQELKAQGTPANSEAFNAYNGAQQGLNKSLDLYINAVKLAYPDLKADTQFINLQTVLEGTENRIATERGRYTDVVKNYNIAVKSFPAVIFTSMFGYHEKPQFKADEAAATAPKVEF